MPDEVNSDGPRYSLLVLGKLYQERNSLSRDLNVEVVVEGEIQSNSMHTPIPRGGGGIPRGLNIRYRIIISNVREIAYKEMKRSVPAANAH